MLPMDIMRAHLVISSCWQRTFQFHWLWWITSCDCLRNKFQERIWARIQMPSCWAWRRGYLPSFTHYFQNTEICQENNLTFQKSSPQPGSPWELTASSELHPPRDWPQSLVGWRGCLVFWLFWVFIVPRGISSYGAHALECRLSSGAGA